MTAPAPTRRALAVAAAEGTCPRCGTPRAATDRYCLECGFALPTVTGRVASLRRRWIVRVGWYPGDWVWGALLALLVAAAAAAAAIVLSDDRRTHAQEFAIAPAAVSLGEPATPVETTTRARSTNTGTLPAAPEPGSGHAKRASTRIAWPLGENGWTIVLVSYPKTTGRAAALTTAARAARSGLSDVGIIDSSRYASLQPGYYVVFTGVYGSKADADAAVATARQAGFAGAYSREIAR